MAELPIKTKIMDLIAARVGEVSLINTVARVGSLPENWEIAEKPAAFVYDTQELNVEQRNNIRRAQFDLNIEIRMRSESGREAMNVQMDILQADVYQKLVWDCGASLKAYGVRIREDQSPVAVKKFDDEYLGALMLAYTVTYHTNAKSLYTKEYDVNTNLNP